MKYDGSNPLHVQQARAKLEKLIKEQKEDKFLGRIKYLRSLSDLDSTEFSLTIERFRNFASAQCGIYIPSPDEERLIQLMEIEVEQNKFHI